MTEKEIEKRAEESLEKRSGTYGYNNFSICAKPYKDGFFDGYFIGMKENGVVWHDLRKNPHDVPLQSSIFHEVLNQNGNKVFWDNVNKCWNMCFRGNIVRANTPLYWCEIPKFEEM